MWAGTILETYQGIPLGPPPAYMRALSIVLDTRSTLFADMRCRLASGRWAGPHGVLSAFHGIVPDPDLFWERNFEFALLAAVVGVRM